MCMSLSQGINKWPHPQHGLLIFTVLHLSRRQVDDCSLHAVSLTAGTGRHMAAAPQYTASPSHWCVVRESVDSLSLTQWGCSQENNRFLPHYLQGNQ